MGLSSGAPKGQAGATCRRQGMQAVGEFRLQDRPGQASLSLAPSCCLCISGAFLSFPLPFPDCCSAVTLLVCLSVCLYPFACHPASLSVSSWPCASLSLHGAVSLSAPVSICLSGERERDLKNWLTQLWKRANPKSAGWARVLEPREELMWHIPSEGHLLENFLLLGGSQPFVLFGPLTDWMRPTHIIEGNLLYSKSTYLNVNHL